jgi:hypothetical protein
MSVFVLGPAQNVPSSHWPTSDVTDRHSYGVRKNGKPTSTGGGRSWSEEDEVYLLRSRLQKMPYKHIATHLKKSELACRLHYHQISHGGNRRRRPTSVSSSSSSGSQAHMGLPIHGPISRSDTPDPQLYSPEIMHVQLPPPANLVICSDASAPPQGLPQPVTILPKPASPRQFTPAPTQLYHLDWNPPARQPIDHQRLTRIYRAHRTIFWDAIARDYGHGASPAELEHAYLRVYGAGHGPPTPCASPGNGTVSEREDHGSTRAEDRSRATSISSLLGIDASPRSPDERELVRRIEAGRV